MIRILALFLLALTGFLLGAWLLPYAWDWLRLRRARREWRERVEMRRRWGIDE